MMTIPKQSHVTGKTYFTHHRAKLGTRDEVTILEVTGALTVVVASTTLLPRSTFVGNPIARYNHRTHYRATIRNPLNEIH